MTLARILDKKKMTTTGENAGRYHLKIRLTYTRDKKTYQKYFLTKVYATDAEFEKIIGNPGKDVDLQKKQSIVNALYEKGKSILRNNPYIDPDEFGAQLSARGSLKDPLGFMLAYAEEMEREGRIGNRDAMNQAHSSFKTFCQENNINHLSFAQVTPKFLMKYENWMLARGKSITTVGIYARAMRTVFNIARSDRYKEIPSEMYPFGKGKYQIPTGKGRKMALNEFQKNVLTSYRTLDPKKQKAADMWIFSYYINGINFADMARLRFKHIIKKGEDDCILFVRAKTKLTKRDQVEIEAAMNSHVWEIIYRWGNKSLNPNDYIFPVLKDGLTPAQIKNRVHDFYSDTNAGLADVCNELGLPRITTYWARHTHATILYGKGVSKGQIKKNLGHGNEETTENYLGSFDFQVIKKASNLL
jgi:integrase/recombinase XerD